MVKGPGPREGPRGHGGHGFGQGPRTTWKGGWGRAPALGDGGGTLGEGCFGEGPCPRAGGFGEGPDPGGMGRGLGGARGATGPLRGGAKWTLRDILRDKGWVGGVCGRGAPSGRKGGEPRGTFSVGAHGGVFGTVGGGRNSGHGLQAGATKDFRNVITNMHACLFGARLSLMLGKEMGV